MKLQFITIPVSDNCDFRRKYDVSIRVDKIYMHEPSADGKLTYIWGVGGNESTVLSISYYEFLQIFNPAVTEYNKLELI